MVLSKNYIGRLLFGWGLFGSCFFEVSKRYIGGAATFLFLVGVAAWSLFPMLHFVIAAILAQHLKKDPPAIVSIMFVFFAIMLLLVVLATGFFHYV